VSDIEALHAETTKKFGEDPAKYSVVEWIGLFCGFATDLKNAATENQARRLKEEEAKKREALAKAKKAQPTKISGPAPATIVPSGRGCLDELEERFRRMHRE
jgi:hypothetical protein